MIKPLETILFNLATLPRETLHEFLRNLHKDNLISHSHVNNAPSFIVATQVVNADEEEGKGILQRRIEAEVESRVLRQQNNVVVAEPMDSSTAQHSDRTLMGLTLVVGVVAGVVVSKQQTAASESTGNKPETLRRELSFWIYRSDSEEPFEDASSPQSRALDWLLNDTIALSENGVTSKVLVRYALAVFYYSTDGPNWNDDVGFLSESDECSWNNGLIVQDDDDTGYSFGLRCTPTVNLQLRQPGLNGTIPWELSLLSDLYFLRIDENSLVGTIPSELGRLSVLETLNFANNSLAGTLPTELGALTSRAEFSMDGNNLVGTIPTEFGGWTLMEKFWVGSNDLVGTLPTELGRWSSLLTLEVDFTLLTGTVPTELGRLTSLTRLDLNNYGLTGTLPTELGQLTALTRLWVTFNYLTGPLPTQLGQLTSLMELGLFMNSFSGTLPTEIEACMSLQTLLIGPNKFTGMLPTGLGQLSALEMA